MLEIPANAITSLKMQESCPRDSELDEITHNA